MLSTSAGIRLCRVLAPLLAFLATRGAFAQNAPPRAEVELPLGAYDALRAAAKEKKPEIRETPWGSARLLRGTLGVDLAARRATWEAEIAAVGAGEAPPAVPLVGAGASIGRSAVVPEGATLQSDGSGTRLLPPEAGTWRVTLAGEIAAQGSDEAAGLRFPLPRLASVPAAFDVTFPAEAAVTAEGALVTAGAAKGATRTARVTLDRDRAAVLVVTRASRAAAGAPVVDAALHTVVRLAEETVRTEVRLDLAVRRGLLETRRLVLPPGSLVSVSGPALVDGPAKDGTTLLKLAPEVGEGGQVTLLLTLVAPRDAAAAAFTPALPRLEAAPTDRLETELTVVSEGGLLLTPSGDDDWAPRASMDGVRVGADETALGFVARGAHPKPPAFAVRRLKALAVASALARVTLVAFVGESGETRTRVAADVRSSGRALLRFRVPEEATLLAARVDGRAAAASRPGKGLVEVPIDSGAGRTTVELLLAGKGAPPKKGEPLVVASAGPDEPVERVSWMLVLPPGLSVKEPAKTLPPAPQPPAARPRDREEPPPGERAAAEEAARLAEEDRRARRDGSWSPLAALPAAPLAYTTEMADLDGPVPPLSVTLVETKEKSSWY